MMTVTSKEFKTMSLTSEYDIDDVALRRKSSICLYDEPISEEPVTLKDLERPEYSFLTAEERNKVYATTVAANMATYGFLPSKELFERMVKDPRIAEQVNMDTVPKLAKMKSADITLRPMYPNFPREVMEKDTFELYFNAVVHYISGGKLYPEIEKDERNPLDEKINYQVVGVLSEKEVETMCGQIMNSSVPYSVQDLMDIEVLAKRVDPVKVLPKAMPNKENLITLTKFMTEHNYASLSDFGRFYKSPTDVLRLINAEHGNGDVTLSTFTGVDNLSRSERQKYIALLSKCKNTPEEMKVHAEEWKRVAGKLHAGDYVKKYPKVAHAIDMISDREKNKTVKTFNAKAQQSLDLCQDKNTPGLIALYELATDQPGKFFRQLDSVIRGADKERVDTITSRIIPLAAEKVTPQLLLSVYGHFKREESAVVSGEENKLRIYNTRRKGKSYIKAEPDKREPLGVEKIKKVEQALAAALREKYKDKPPMGKVYVNPLVAGYKIPNETRTANCTSQPTPFGSRLALEENKNVMRSFIWWTNDNNERIDIDLSAVGLDKDFRPLDRCSYYELKNPWATHSGDITDGGSFDGDGVAEFLDVDLERAKSSGVKYVAISVNAFTSQPFCTLEHVRCGFMERERELDGEIFEPSTVKQSVDLNTNATNSLVCLFDVESREVIWMDAPGMSSFNHGINNVDAQIDSATTLAYKAVHSEVPSVGSVIAFNVLAREGSEFVSNRDEADIVFDIGGEVREGQRLVLPTDLSYFSGELIPNVTPEMEKAEPSKEKPVEPDFEF